MRWSLSWSEVLGETRPLFEQLWQMIGWLVNWICDWHPWLDSLLMDACCLVKTLLFFGLDHLSWTADWLVRIRPGSNTTIPYWTLTAGTLGELDLPWSLHIWDSCIDYFVLAELNQARLKYLQIVFDPGQGQSSNGDVFAKGTFNTYTYRFIYIYV